METEQFLEQHGQTKTKTVKRRKRKALNDITVQLLNARTNRLVQDKDGKVLEVKTDNEGRYLLNNLTAGEYIVIFKYDNKEYTLATYKVAGASEEENSNAILKDLKQGKNNKTSVNRHNKNNKQKYRKHQLRTSNITNV